MRDFEEDAEHSAQHSAQHSSSFREDPEEDEDEDETSYGLEKGMELFEVSSKDNQGVQDLFAHLIKNIIQRRDIIEREKDLRTRDSIALSTVPTWGNMTDNGDQAVPASPAQKNGGWSCCSS